MLDIDPKLAAAMANDVAVFADTLIDKMQKVRSKKAYELIKDEYGSLEKAIKIEEDSLFIFRKLGIIDFYDQSIILTRAYYRALTKGQAQVANEIKNKMELISKYGTTYNRIKDWVNLQRMQLSALFYKYSEAKTEYEQYLPHKYIVESARVSEKKAYPKRLLIILTASISAVFFAFVLMLIVDSIKNNK